MTFELKPGDWIPTCEVPKDKRQAVIDAFVVAGASNIGFVEIGVSDFFDHGNVGWWGYDFDTFNRDLDRRVTLSQILGEEIAENANCSWDQVGPELLQAAKVALQALDYYDEYNERHMAAPGMLKAAIEKAKGAS